MRILSLDELEVVAGAGSSDAGFYDLPLEEQQRILAEEAAADAAANRLPGLPGYLGGTGGGLGDSPGGGGGGISGAGGNSSGAGTGHIFWDLI